MNIDIIGTSGQIFGAFSVWLAGALFALGQRRLFRVPRGRAAALYIWHSVFTLVYVLYSTIAAADGTHYYFASLAPNISFKAGTDAVVFLASIFTQDLGMSYVGVFLAFGILGYMGLVALYSALNEIAATKSPRARTLAGLVVFLPGLNFWSSALGKDSISFLGAGLICWASLRIQRRYLALILAIAAFWIVRPHIAGLLMVSLAFAVIIAARMSLSHRILLAMIIVPLSIYAVALALRYIGLSDTASLAQIGNYIEKRQGYNLEGNSSVNIKAAWLPVRYFILMFEPLFYKASGIFGLLVSIENIAVLALFLGYLRNRLRRRTQLPNFTSLFLGIFVFLTWTILANTIANLGIAVRQKIMFEPALLLLIFATMRTPRPFHANRNLCP